VCKDLEHSASERAIEIAALDGIQFPTDRAIPLILIATELITNAGKHAYPDHAKGKVKVTLSKEGQAHILLTVGDDGVRLPSGFSLGEAKGLGMRIVKAFAQQLGASVDVRAAREGKRFELLVPLHSP
jgi:two-component sensor histidine kinase